MQAQVMTFKIIYIRFQTNKKITYNINVRLLPQHKSKTLVGIHIEYIT